MFHFLNIELLTAFKYFEKHLWMKNWAIHHLVIWPVDQKGSRIWSKAKHQQDSDQVGWMSCKLIFISFSACKWKPPIWEALKEKHPYGKKAIFHVCLLKGRAGKLCINQPELLREAQSKGWRKPSSPIASQQQLFWLLSLTS